MNDYSITIGPYTNKQGVTKQWLFVRKAGAKGSWGDVLLSPQQCLALMANLETVRKFAAEADAQYYSSNRNTAA